MTNMVSTKSHQKRAMSITGVRMACELFYCGANTPSPTTMGRARDAAERGTVNSHNCWSDTTAATSYCVSSTQIKSLLKNEH